MTTFLAIMCGVLLVALAVTGYVLYKVADAIVSLVTRR